MAVECIKRLLDDDHETNRTDILEEDDKEIGREEKEGRMENENGKQNEGAEKVIE